MKQPRRRVTITDVAKKAGVSLATVSFALNGKGRVSDATRRRVLGVAKRLGFVRDQTAVSLRSGQSQLIGVVVHDMSNPIHAELIAAIETGASSDGYLTIIADSGDDPERQRDLLAAMASHGVAGLIVIPANGSVPEDFEVVQSMGIPLVITVRRLVGLDADYVGTDNRSGGRLATTYLCEQGHKHIAFAGGWTGTAPWRARKAGIMAELASRKLTLDRASFHPGRPNREFGREVVGRILESNPKTTAIFCYNDIVALGVCSELTRRGLRIPEDISVMGFDNLPGSDAVIPPLTTIELFPRKLGRLAADRLLERLAGDTSPPSSVRLNPELRKRHSVAPPPKRRRGARRLALVPEGKPSARNQQP